MSAVAVEPAGVAIDYDRSVWLAGPPGGSDPNEVEQWIRGAHHACVTDFQISPSSAEARYLFELLNEFATADLGCEFRFLRLREIDDVPLVVRLNLLTALAGDGEAATALDDTGEGEVYGRAPQMEVVDAERGLTRRVWYATDSGLQPLVRHHRRVPECGVDIIVSCLFPSLKAAVLDGAADMDEFARSVWIVDAEGGRW